MAHAAKKLIVIPESIRQQLLFLLDPKAYVNNKDSMPENPVKSLVTNTIFSGHGSIFDDAPESDTTERITLRASLAKLGQASKALYDATENGQGIPKTFLKDQLAIFNEAFIEINDVREAYFKHDKPDYQPEAGKLAHKMFDGNTPESVAISMANVLKPILFKGARSGAIKDTDSPRTVD